MPLEAKTNKAEKKGSWINKVLRVKHDKLAQLRVLGPAAEYLEEDFTATSKSTESLPPEVACMLQSVRMFGIFERHIFLELRKYIKTCNVSKGQYLFRIGDADDNFYVIQSGKLNVFITESEGTTITLKVVKEGDSIASLLSFTDVLTGHPQPFKTVSAQALEDSIVLKLPVTVFQEVFEKHPETFVRVIQIIMVRLHRVTLTALHQHLGLSRELVRSSQSAPTSASPPGSTVQKIESEALLRQAVNAFKINLGLDDETGLREIIRLKDIPGGTYVAKEEFQHMDCGLALVLSGVLTLSQREDDRDVLMFSAQPGDFVGALAVLTEEPSIFTIQAKNRTKIAAMSSSSFYSLMAVKPKIVLHVAYIVVKRLSPFVRQIDFAMDWIFLEGGRALYRQGDESDCTYIVLSGRLRSVITRPDAKKQLVGEYGRGDIVGIVETLTSSQRSATVMGVRDTELTKLPESLLNAIKLKYPAVLTRLIHLLGQRILGTWQQPHSHGIPKIENRPSHVNFSTVAVLAVTDDVPLSAFSHELIHSLSNIGAALRLTSDCMKQLLGKSILDSANESKLNSWLAQQEDKHRIVLYQCDNTLTVWTKRSIRQADCILIVGVGDAEPGIGKVEKQLEHLAFRTQKELVLLHKEGSRPRGTALWLNVRTWCSSHHHLQCPNRMFTNKAKMPDYITEMMKTEPSVHSDFSRLARWLTGTSVGLVLGGGGARGAAHIGMLKSIQEAGIPIDMVGGVSIGAFMSGLYAMERDLIIVTKKARKWANKMTQMWRQVLDLTYPVTSMFSGAGFNQTIKDAFKDTQIEDLWLPYFNITTDITSSAMRVHTYGSLWRYTRASMSLSGYMPPLCDPLDGHLLLDGGYVCNLPSDVMKAQGARYILAVDVGSQDETDFTNYGDSLSGWWLLWQRWTSCCRKNIVKVPDLSDIQSRPPIDKYKTLQFGSFDEIKDVGYEYGKTCIEKMAKDGDRMSLNSVQTSNPKA